MSFYVDIIINYIYNFGSFWIIEVVRDFVVLVVAVSFDQFMIKESIHGWQSAAIVIQNLKDREGFLWGLKLSIWIC